MADTKTKASTAAESKAEPEIAQAARTWTETLREAGKSVANAAIAMQDRNVQFTQVVVDQGLKQIEEQTATVRKLYDTLASQSEARRAAFRTLGREAVETYIGFLATPVKLARRTAETLWVSADQSEGGEA
jgi:hypothetical protein